MRRLLCVALLLSIATIPALAGATKFARGKADVPPRHLADVPPHHLAHALDGELIQVTNHVDGHSWSAWAYRNGGEYDLAVSISSVPGVWSEPRLLGLDDGLDQGHPALAIDARGAVYLAYSSGDGALIVRGLQPFSVAWSDGLRIEVSSPLSRPSLLVVGDSLVLGFRDGERVGLTTLPLLAAVETTASSIYDGPDPIGGREEDDEDDDDGQPTGSSSDGNPRGRVELLPVGDAAGNSDQD